LAVRSDRAVIGALTVLAILLRLPNLGRSYWIDEAISVGISSHRLSQMPALLREDGSPPLFYVILHFWILLFGTSPDATHVLPLLLSLAAIPVAYWAAGQVFDRRAGLGAAALVATNPFLNWYSTETRMYTLVVLLALAGSAFAWRAVRDRRPGDAVAAVAVNTALLYTHDWGLYLAGATALVLLWWTVSTGDRALTWWVVGGGAACLVLWLPWVPSFLYQAGNTAAPWAVRPGVGDFFADPATALGGTLGIIVVPLLAFGAWSVRNRVSEADRKVAGVIAGFALVATIAGFVGAEMEPSWTVRYLAVIVGPYLLAAAGMLSSSRRGRAVIWATCGIVAVGALIGSVLPNPNGRYAKDNMAAVAQAVAPQLATGDVVVATQTEQVPVAHFYLPAGLHYLTPTGPVTNPGIVDWRNIVARLRQAAPCPALGPTLDDMPVGAHVLEIDPVRNLGASGSAWATAVNSQVRAVDQFLREDPALKPIGVYQTALDPRPFAPVDGVLYEKISLSPSCS
jgi:4-amino-4-deoxy-L-arabinose transferase-like glycosyltransferase